MDIESYFSEMEGTGILGTADAEGSVNMALYARPHVIDDSTVAFIMNNRQSYRNLQENGRAAYLFIEKGPGYRGMRLSLRLLRESTDRELIDSFRRRDPRGDDAAGSTKYLVYFTVEQVKPLLGNQEGP
ncbi:MAG: pyridoxamine 5'-phosphate oxidase family protein [Spirochaetes bacterium]|nr:pyridoxamine 5'-phosphate oxidase family protein [Spirochaetota bacterium]